MIVEAFSSMQEDLDKERKATMKQLAKSEEQIERVMGATVGMYGDLQGNEAGLNSFNLFAQKWVDAAGAIGLHTRTGWYEGTWRKGW